MSGDKTNTITKNGIMSKLIDDASRTDMPTQSEKNAGEAPANVEENVDVKQSRSNAPIDRGWAWVVLAVSCLVMFLFGGILRSFGVYFVEYQKRFKSSASETAIMVMIQNLVVSFSSLLVMTVVVEKITCRGAVMTAGFLFLAAYVITSFTTSLTVYYLAQGLMGGLAFASALPPFLATLGAYFNKHRGLATSIFSSSISVGGIVFPPVVVKLFAEYGFSGTILITGAVAFNIVLMGAVIRPLDSFNTAHVDKQLIVSGEETISASETKIKDDFEMTNARSAASNAEHDTVCNVKERVSPIKRRRLISYNHEQAMVDGQASPLLVRARAYSTGHGVREKNNDVETQNIGAEEQHHSHMRLRGIIDAVTHSQTTLGVSVNNVYVSCLDIPSENIQCIDAIEDIKQSEKEVTYKPKQDNIFMRLKDSVVSIFLNIFDLNLLKDPKFILFSFMAFPCVSGIALIPVFIPPLATDIGISYTQIGLSVSIYAGVDTGAKIVLGVVADRKWVRRTSILAFLGFCMGTFCHLTRYVTDFNTLVVFTVVSGLCCGQYNSMFSVVLVELVGLQLFKKALGLVTFLHGISIAIVFPLAGFLRDISGSYIYAFHLLGSLLYLGAIVAVLISVVIARHEAKTLQGQEDTETPPKE